MPPTVIRPGIGFCYFCLLSVKVPSIPGSPPWLQLPLWYSFSHLCINAFALFAIVLESQVQLLRMLTYILLFPVNLWILGSFLSVLEWFIKLLCLQDYEKIVGYWFFFKWIYYDLCHPLLKEAGGVLGLPKLMACTAR